MVISETFSEGTPFQPLIICFVYRVMIGKGRTFRFAVASYRPKGFICEKFEATSEGLLVFDEKIER